MFAYRHAFHAGNHADVFKHAVLVAAIELLQKKEAPLLLVDTHAGAGLYTLKSPLVRDKGEWPSGIGKIWGQEDIAPDLKRYYGLISRFNQAGKLTHYPGSAVIMNEMLREEDRLRAFEMHPSDIGPLQLTVKGKPRQVKAERKDGFAQLRALLPPACKRGLILIDPPYEMREDYTKTITALKEGLSRFATGTYMVWIPQIARYQVDRLTRQIAQLGVKNTLFATLHVRPAQADGLGLTGSTLAILNPPYGLEEVLHRLLPWLTEKLGQHSRAGYKIIAAPIPLRVGAAAAAKRQR